MKRKLFIGSSSGNGVVIAKKVAAEITKRCGDWLECDVWNDGKTFEINVSTLQSLARAAQRDHYGVFVATPDDKTVKKKASVLEPRDNVIFEMGLFLGSLGVSRVFLMVQEGANLPSDFLGITMPPFSPKVKGSTMAAINGIVAKIEATQKTFNLKPIPSAALALGYFQNFLRPFAERYWRNDQTPIATVKMLLPGDLITVADKRELETLIDSYGAAVPSEDVSIFKPGTRPAIKKATSSSTPLYWDVPTTIFTLKELLDKLPSNADAIGVDQEKKEWLCGEVEEFARAVMELAAGSQTIKRGVVLEAYWLEMKGGKPVETPLV
jgi:Predicted nucleotide-binding protein containing TIR-like domain